MIYTFKIIMKGWTYEIVNEHSQVNWSVVSKFFIIEMNERISYRNYLKNKGRFFFMEAKILDTNKQSSNENFNVIFLQNYT